MKTQQKSEYICRNCGLAVHHFFYGWKHCVGWRTKRLACKTPVPVPRFTPK